MRVLALGPVLRAPYRQGHGVLREMGSIFLSGPAAGALPFPLG